MLGRIPLTALVLYHTTLYLMARYTLSIPSGAAAPASLLSVLVFAAEVCRLLVCAICMWVDQVSLSQSRSKHTGRAVLSGALGALADLALLVLLRNVGALECALVLPVARWLGDTIASALCASSSSPTAISSTSSSQKPQQQRRRQWTWYVAVTLWLLGLGMVAYEPPMEAPHYRALIAAASASSSASSTTNPSALARLQGAAQTRAALLGLGAVCAWGLLGALSRLLYAQGTSSSEVSSSSSSSSSSAASVSGSSGSSVVELQRQFHRGAVGTGIMAIIVLAQWHTGSNAASAAATAAAAAAPPFRLSLSIVALVVLQGGGAVLVSLLLSSASARSRTRGHALFTALLVLLLSLLLPSFALLCTPLCLAGVACALGAMWLQMNMLPSPPADSELQLDDGSEEQVSLMSSAAHQQHQKSAATDEESPFSLDELATGGEDTVTAVHNGPSRQWPTSSGFSFSIGTTAMMHAHSNHARHAMVTVRG